METLPSRVGKGGLISESFSLQKEVQNHHPKIYPPKEKMVRIAIWYLARTFLPK